MLIGPLFSAAVTLGVGCVTEVILHTIRSDVCLPAAVNCRELNDDVSSNVVAFSSCTSKDNKHSMTNPIMVTTASAVASTTNSHCQPVLPASSFRSATSTLPHLFSAPPIASLEDLTNGEQNSDITSARSYVASPSATTAGRSRIRRNDLRGYFPTRRIEAKREI